MTIFFDMDGTLADLYGIENWLEYLINKDTFPYENAKPLINLNTLARMLNKRQKEGISIGIISWLSKSGDEDYNRRITKAKQKWLSKHLKSVHFDETIIVKYGESKEQFRHTEMDILFDDEKNNREEWNGRAFDVNNIIEILKGVE